MAIAFFGLPIGVGCGLGAFWAANKTNEATDPRNPHLVSDEEDDRALQEKAFKNERTCEKIMRASGIALKTSGSFICGAAGAIFPIFIAEESCMGNCPWKPGFGTLIPICMLGTGGLFVAAGNVLVNQGTKTANAYLQSPAGREEIAKIEKARTGKQEQIQQLERESEQVQRKLRRLKGD